MCKIVLHLPDSPTVEQTAAWCIAQLEGHEVELFHGIVLKTDERITRLLEAIPQLKQAVLRKLGANVFLMDSFSYPQWSKALKDSLGFLPSLQGESFAAEIAATPKDLDCQSMTPISSAISPTGSCI